MSEHVTPPSSDTDKERLEAFKKDISEDASVTTEQRDKSNEDMRFINVSGGMWEGFLESEFAKRTKLEFDIISNYINRFIGQWNQNRVGVDFKPDDAETSDDDAELLNGIYRADFRQFSGKMAVDNAVDEQATCGYGAFKLGTKFIDDEDPENDLQRIEWRPIHNAYSSIFWDRSAKRIDKRDADYVTELIQFTNDSFEKAYPGKTAASAFEPLTRRFQNLNATTTQPIYIAKRYEIIKKKESVFVYNNLVSGEVEVYSKEDHELIKDELKANEFKTFVRERKLIRQRVEVTVFSGEEILEKTRRIAGKWLPIVPIYGYHSYIDSVEWYRGLVRKLMDASRLFNMQISQLAENSASTGQDIPIFDPEQVEGAIGNLWADRNNKPYLLARALRDKDGNIVHHGPTSYLKPAQLDGSTTALMQVVPNFIQEVTGGAPQDVMDQNMSGKLFRAIQKRNDLNTQVLSDNIANSVEWSGVVYESMATEVYASKRMVSLIGKDGMESQRQLMQVVQDEKSGKLIEANNLLGKKFRVYADVGPQYDTLREQTVEDLKGMLAELNLSEAGQKYTPAVIATILENVSGVGLGPLKKVVRQDMILQGLVKPETDEEKQFLAQAQQPKEDPNAKLLEAAAKQAEGEARERESKVLDNTAAAQLKTARTEEVLAGIDIDEFNAQTGRLKTLEDVRREVFQSAQQGTLQ